MTVSHEKVKDLIQSRESGYGLPTLLHVAAAVIRHVDIESLTQDYADYKLVFNLSPAESAEFDRRLSLISRSDLSDAKALHIITSSFSEKRYTKAERSLVVSTLLMLYRNHDDVLDVDADSLARDLGLASKDVDNNVFARSEAPRASSVSRANASDDDFYEERPQTSVKFAKPVAVFGVTNTVAPVRIRRTSNA